MGKYFLYSTIFPMVLLERFKTHVSVFYKQQPLLVIGVLIIQKSYILEQKRWYQSK
jgi:hypothetical protein